MLVVFPLSYLGFNLWEAFELFLMECPCRREYRSGRHKLVFQYV
jgi:hypothetical protein